MRVGQGRLRISRGCDALCGGAFGCMGFSAHIIFQPDPTWAYEVVYLESQSGLARPTFVGWVMGRETGKITRPTTGQQTRRQ